MQQAHQRYISGMAKKNRDFLGIVESRWALAQQFGALPVLGAAATAYAASFLEFMHAWSPLSYVLAGLVGAILVQGWALLRISWAEKKKLVIRYQELEAPKSTINPREKIFQGKRISLNDLLLPGSRSIQNKTFINCDIVGPINLAATGHVTIKNNDGGLDIVIVRNDANICNVVVLENPVFENCTFHRITLFIPKNSIEMFKGLFDEGANVVTEIPTNQDEEIQRQPPLNIEPKTPQ